MQFSFSMHLFPVRGLLLIQPIWSCPAMDHIHLCHMMVWGLIMSFYSLLVGIIDWYLKVLKLNPKMDMLKLPLSNDNFTGGEVLIQSGVVYCAEYSAIRLFWIVIQNQ